MNADAGFVFNGIRALTGVPVFPYFASQLTSNEALDEMFDLLYEAESNNWLMGATSAGVSDNYNN